MEPTIKELNIKKTLTSPVTVNGKVITEVNIKKLILRPVLKRVVFITEEFDRVIVYEGEADFESHKEDSIETLTTVLLAKIAADHA